MTGFEVMGVVLGALPLAISFFEHYSDGVNILADIWNVNHEIDAFVKSLKVQELIFRTTIVEFLGPACSQQELKSLLKDHHSDAWRAPSLCKNLRSQYSGSYETYLIILERISRTVQALHSVAADLGLQAERGLAGESDSSAVRSNGGDIAQPLGSISVVKDAKNGLSQSFGPGIAQGLARARFALLRNARRELLTRLSNDIGQFTELHHSDVKITRNARKWDIGARFRHRRDDVSSIHNVLAHDWRCNCTYMHDVYLQLSLLDTKASDSDHKEQIIVFKCPEQSNKPRTGPVLCQKVTLTVTEVQEVAAYLDAGPTLNAEVGKSRNAKSPSLKKLTRLVSREKKEKSSPVAAVRFAPAPNLGGSQSNPARRIDQLCDALHHKSPVSQHPVGFLLDNSGQRRVHFRKSSEPGELARASMQSLLASTPSTTDTTTVDSAHRETIQPSPDPADMPSASRKSSKIRKRFKLGETFGIAAILSSSLLQMHTTPWISERWNGADIQFLHPADRQPASTCMYLHRQYHSPPSCKPPGLGQEKHHDTAETRENRDEIFSLGIMLLELLYESPFAEQEALFTDGGDADCYSRQTAAAAWLEDIPRNSDFHLLKYDKIVQDCLECNFGVGFGSLNTCLWNGDFREAMYSHVVEPLERLASIARSR